VDVPTCLVPKPLKGLKQQLDTLVGMECADVAKAQLPVWRGPMSVPGKMGEAIAFMHNLPRVKPTTDEAIAEISTRSDNQLELSKDSVCCFKVKSLFFWNRCRYRLPQKQLREGHQPFQNLSSYAPPLVISEPLPADKSWQVAPNGRPAPPRNPDGFRTAIAKKICTSFATDRTIIQEQETIRTDQTIVMERVDNSSSRYAGQAHQVIPEAQVIMEMNDVGAKLGQSGTKRLLQKRVRPVGDSAIFHAVNAVKKRNPGIDTPLQAAW
jgi:hypothetical protein